MDHFIDSINKPTLFPTGQTPAVVLSYTAIMNLKGLHAWMDYCRIHGQALNLDLFSVLCSWCYKEMGESDRLSRPYVQNT
jgi:hypothetical protein